MAKEKYSTVSVRITAEEKEAILAYCDANDMSMSQVIRKAVKQYLSGQDRTGQDR